MVKKILIALLVVFVLIQFIRPEKNLSGDETYAASKTYPMSAEVSHVMEVACYDCHSNKTRYPWYAEVQPSAWWLAAHVDEGKDELNFSEFTKRKLATQNHKFDEIIELVKEGDMPRHEYTWLGMHPEANLSPEQRDLITNWAQTQMDYLKATYPADSLVRKKH